MAVKIENISAGKIIGIGNVVVLPGETKEVPKSYEASPILEMYRLHGFAKITGGPDDTFSSEDKVAAGKAAATKNAAKEAETLRRARLASLNGIGEEELGKLAYELGINPAECKDQADVLKKVKAALRK